MMLPYCWPASSPFHCLDTCVDVPGQKHQVDLWKDQLWGLADTTVHDEDRKE